MPAVTLFATNRISAAMLDPNDFSQPIAKIGMERFPRYAGSALLWAASRVKAPNCSKASCIA
jgi:hypothetical protein